ncbi:hypothetical protein MT390_15415 [Vibrio sp. 2-Bac 85]
MNLETLIKKSKTELWTLLPVLFLGVTIPTLCWFGFFKGAIEPSSWFQRSGSITVLLAVWAEFKIFKLNESINPRSKSGQTWDNLKHADILHKKFAGYLNSFKVIAAMLAISGTIICGYGDLLYELLY